MYFSPASSWPHDSNQHWPFPRPWRTVILITWLLLLPFYSLQIRARHSKCMMASHWSQNKIQTPGHALQPDRWSQSCWLSNSIARNTLFLKPHRSSSAHFLEPRSPCTCCSNCFQWSSPGFCHGWLFLVFQLSTHNYFFRGAFYNHLSKTTLTLCLL